MPYVQTSVATEELAELHSRAIKSGKTLQRLIYEYIVAGLEKEKENERRNQASEKTRQKR